MKATNIKWEVNMDDVCEQLDQAVDCPEELYDFLGLPVEVELPDGLPEEEIADWLSDKYGYCHDGFVLLEEKKTSQAVGSKPPEGKKTGTGSLSLP